MPPPSGSRPRFYDAIHDNVATKADAAAVRAELREMEQRLKIWLGSAIAAAAGAVIAVLHFWPPHG